MFRVLLGVCCFAVLAATSFAEPGKSKADPELRRPEVPAGEGTEVDRFLWSYYSEHGIPTEARVEDSVFLRRIYLDLVGRLPTPQELDAFAADQRDSTVKRAELIDRLLADNEGYAAHWISFWQDLLRDGKQDLGSTDIFRAITPWLARSLRENKPLDQFVRELADPPLLEKVLSIKTPDQDDGKSLDQIPLTDDDPSGFLVGLRAGLETPRGDQAWEVQAAQNLSQVFLGVPLKCATCHDSFLDNWTMDDSWNMAAIYAVKPLEIVRCELPTGKEASPHFLLPEVGDVDPNASPKERRAQLAQLMTSPKNGLFARTLVNRIWARLMGRGLTSLEDSSEKSWHPDLLDWLAADLVDHRFDAKHLIKRIVSSQAYQRAAVAIDPEEKNVVFRGPAIRRLTAEQYLDGIHAIVGRDKRVWTDNGSKFMEILGRPDHRTVTLCRDDKASTMQSLELLNGEAIHELIYGLRRELPKVPGDKGVKLMAPIKLDPPPQQLLEELSKLSTDELIDRLCKHALSRFPSNDERAVLREIVGEKPSSDSAGDLVWALVVLPEFQLVR